MVSILVLAVNNYLSKIGN